ncbi:L-histidine N(alpha)-methyltransferase [Aestuariibacter sp. AA17]|uniref:L-histidine N(Alpha)-methyltransferase n=1 Tax=Fluctibacter corallii TaxID=2984329 RepID=A0ABT3AD66_9ALTE|nr:L-histidine N(alpha)-methyltransferase [Aestuariibacter sp. AA17]MCV2886201.1 L-histidine N(alpha)-methyltransferase [Aestuariibacter sp. AA17]
MSIFPTSTFNEFAFYDFEPETGDMLNDVVKGLSSLPKRLSPKYFYDETGSTLFDQICTLPEYYVTRTEISLLRAHASEMAESVGKQSTLFELGSGSSLKIRMLLDALKPNTYIPMDISKQHLLNASEKIATDYPWLDVNAVCVDYSQYWDSPFTEAENKVAFFPGSSLGNFEPNQAKQLLTRIAQLLGQGGMLLIGIDLRKDISILEPAYNDAAGVTAAFNKNILSHINRELSANFNPTNFIHKAIWNDALSRIEMHLLSTSAQEYSVGEHTFYFGEGESIHTENSYKYSVDGFQALAKESGYTSENVWVDAQDLFSIHLFSVN